MELFNRISEKFRPNEPIQVQELINECDEEDNHLKNTSLNRSHTDVHFLVLHGVLMLILAIILGYSLINGDIDRLRKGYDDCGNVCGKNNNFHIEHQMDCKPKDMTHKPFLYIKGDKRECVESCGNHTVSSTYRCISNEANVEEEEFQEFVKGFFRCLHQCLYEIISLSGIALGFTFIILLMLRYLTAIFIWFTMFGILMVYAGVAAFYGNIASITESVNEKVDAIRTTVLFTIFAFVMAGIIYVMRKRLQLLTELFKEAGKSVIMMPVLLFEPILTFLSLGIIWSAWFYFSLWIESSGTPSELFGKVTFIKTTFMILASLYNIFMMLWMVEFVCGCQNMLIAGAVSSWYFARNKCKLGNPIYNSGKNVIKYHLGTISVTSLIMALIQFVKVLILMLRRTLRFAVCIMYALDYVERWMRYYTKNSCIITAMHGYPFRQAGSQAFKLITENLLQVIVINSAGDFVLVVAKILVAACTIGIGHVMIQDKSNMGYEWAILTFVGLMAYMIAHCFFSVYGVAVDTIFICFCEDRQANDGISRPYFMSPELTEFVDKCKTIGPVNPMGSANAVITA